MTQAMVDCAYALGMDFGQAARAERGLDRSLKLFDAFTRSFQAVRLGIRLSLTLRAEPKAAPQRDEVEAERDEAPERLKVRSERDRGDTERERDYEPVSLARFLSTLRGVAADAARLHVNTDPAVLPTLQGLLAQMDGDVAVKVRPSPSHQRSSLLASTTRPLTLDGLARPRPPPHASG